MAAKQSPRGVKPKRKTPKRPTSTPRRPTATPRPRINTPGARRRQLNEDIRTAMKDIKKRR